MWSIEAEDMLISLVQEKPVIYQASQGKHKDRICIENIFKEISYAMNVMCPQFGHEFTGELNTAFVVWLHFRPYILFYNVCKKNIAHSFLKSRGNQQWSPEVFVGDHSFKRSSLQGLIAYS